MFISNIYHQLSYTIVHIQFCDLVQTSRRTKWWSGASWQTHIQVTGVIGHLHGSAFRLCDNPNWACLSMQSKPRSFPSFPLVPRTMGRKVFKPIDCDADAGTHDERVYDKALHPWRAKLRRMLLPIVRRETPYIAKLQVSCGTTICMDSDVHATYKSIYSDCISRRDAHKEWGNSIRSGPLCSIVTFYGLPTLVPTLSLWSSYQSLCGSIWALFLKGTVDLETKVQVHF